MLVIGNSKGFDEIELMGTVVHIDRYSQDKVKSLWQYLAIVRDQFF